MRAAGLRWAAIGLLGPIEFVGPAEEIGPVVPVGNGVLVDAGEQTLCSQGCATRVHPLGDFLDVGPPPDWVRPDQVVMWTSVAQNRYLKCERM